MLHLDYCGGSGFSLIMPKRKRSASSGRRSNKYAKKRRTQGKIMAVARPLGDPRFLTERKYYDIEHSAGSVATSTSDWTDTEDDPTTPLCFFAPILGNDFSNRIGRKCLVHKWMIRGWLNITKRSGEAAALNTAMVRQIFYIDQATNGTHAQGEQVINSGTAAVAFAMFQNPANFGRFKVLKDRIVKFPIPTVSYDGTLMEVFGDPIPFKATFNFKKPLIVHFNATNGGTVADIVDNSLHLIQNSNYSDMNVTYSYKSRVVYTDA